MYLITNDTITQALGERDAIRHTLAAVNALLYACNHSRDLADEVNVGQVEDLQQSLLDAEQEYVEALAEYENPRSDCFTAERPAALPIPSVPPGAGRTQ